MVDVMEEVMHYAVPVGFHMLFILGLVAFHLVRKLFAYTVHLNVDVEGARSDVYAYLGDFTTNAEWDPNTRDARRLSGSSKDPRKGDKFELTTVFKGNTSKMQYVLKQAQVTQSDSGHAGASRLTLRGESDMVLVRDCITLTDAVGESPMTNVDYCLEVSLKGWRKPFIRTIAADLEELGRESIAGLVTTCARRAAAKKR
jgi:hypothetical protein